MRKRPRSRSRLPESEWRRTGKKWKQSRLGIGSNVGQAAGEKLQDAKCGPGSQRNNGPVRGNVKENGLDR